MEHRCSDRKPIALEAVVSYRGVKLIFGKTRDICLEGMYLEAKRHILPRNAPVKFILKFPPKNTWSGESEAMVVHTTGDGLGLMFTELDADVDAELHYRLYGHDHNGYREDRIHALPVA